MHLHVFIYLTMLVAGACLSTFLLLFILKRIRRIHPLISVLIGLCFLAAVSFISLRHLNAAEELFLHYRTLQGSEYAPTLLEDSYYDTENKIWYYRVKYKAQPDVRYIYTYDPAQGMKCTTEHLAKDMPEPALLYPPRDGWINLK